MDEDYKNKYFLGEELKKERQASDAKYAMKLVEKIVFTLLALIFLAAVGYFFSSIQNKNNNRLDTAVTTPL